MGYADTAERAEREREKEKQMDGACKEESKAESDTKGRELPTSMNGYCCLG
jgi:hypothetical protein